MGSRCRGEAVAMGKRESIAKVRVEGVDPTRMIVSVKSKSGLDVADGIRMPVNRCIGPANERRRDDQRHEPKPTQGEFVLQV